MLFQSSFRSILFPKYLLLLAILPFKRVRSDKSQVKIKRNSVSKIVLTYYYLTI